MPSVRPRPNSRSEPQEENLPSASELIDKLLASGLSPSNVSRITGWPVDDLLNREIPQTDYIPDEDDISRETALFVGKIISQAQQILDHGSLPNRLRLMAMVLPRLTQQLGKNQPREMEDLRARFLDLMSDIPQGNLDESASDSAD